MNAERAPDGWVLRVSTEELLLIKDAVQEETGRLGEALRLRPPPEPEYMEHKRALLRTILGRLRSMTARL